MSKSRFTKRPINLNFLLLVATCSAAIFAQSLVFAQDDQSADDQNIAEGPIIEEVKVTGIRRSLDYAAAVKRDSDSVVDALLAQDIGLFSDNNIGEALGRVPGVLVERDAGEGFRISIRGLGPRFVRTTVNGRTALSPAGGEYSGGEDARGFTYNIMPSEVISTVRVLKSTQSRDIEGGIGGVVDLETNRPLDFADRQEQDFYVSGALRASYNDLLEDTMPRASVFLNNKFNDNFGVYFGAVYDDQDRVDNLSESQNLRTRDIDLKAGTLLNGELLTEDLSNQDYSLFSGVRYQGQEILRDRQTYILGAQWKEGNWDVNFDWTAGFEEEIRDDKRYWTNSEQYARSNEQDLTSITVDYGDATSGQTYNTMGTVTGFEWALGSSGKKMRQNVVAPLYRLLPRDSEINVGGFNVKWSNDVWTVSGDIGHASQDNVRVLERIRNRLDPDNPRFVNGTSGSFDISSGVPIVQVYDSFGDFVDPLDSSVVYLNLLERSITHEQAEDSSARLDFNVALGEGAGGGLIPFVDSIDFGVAYNDMQFRRDMVHKGATESDFDTSTLADVIVDNLLPDNNTPGFVNEFAIWDIRDPQFDVFLDDPDGYQLLHDDSFDVTEETTAAFAQFNFAGGDRYPYRGNVGMRYTSTDQTNRGWIGQGEGAKFVPADPNNPLVTSTRSYNDWLPSFNMALDLSEEWVMRFAANKTFTRPDPIDMSARVSIRDLDEADEDRASGGNPNLLPYSTISSDMALEWYPETGGSYGVGLFYKDLEGFIASGNSDEDLLIEGQLRVFDVSRPVNTDGGTITGIELQFHTPLDFLPGFWQHFGVNGSYTFVDAEMDAVVPSRNVPVSLRGTSENSGNLVVYFEREKFGARVATNYRSAFLHQEASDTDRFDEFTNGRTIIDLNLDYRISERTNIRFSANNLTNERRSRYWDTPGQYYSNETDNGRTFVFEVRMVL